MSGSARSAISPFRQPKAVWAVAFACVVSFMGIGLVDPILPALSKQLRASPSSVELLFTSYLVVTALAMLVTGWVSTRIGGKRTLVAGLVLIVAFSAAAGASGTIGGIIGFRAGWGLGNALFIATSLAVIMGAASGGFSGAIILYESALGIGIALGPLVGGELGGISWRGPFFGVTVLMAVALVATLVLVEPTPKPSHPSSLTAPIEALKHRGLATMSVTALGYNWGFFTLLAFTPFQMHLGIHELGYVFTAWGVLVAIFAVFVAPRAQARLGTPLSLYINLGLLALDLLVIAAFTTSRTTLIVAVIISGAFVGLNNTLTTQAVMLVSPVEKPVASAAYGFVRFIGGGLAPYVASKVAAAVNVHVPFYIGAATVAAAIVVLSTGHSLLTAAEGGEQEIDSWLGASTSEAISSAVGPKPLEARPVLVAIDVTVDSTDVLAAARALAETLACPVEVVHVIEVDVLAETVDDRDENTDSGAVMNAAITSLTNMGLSAQGHLLRVIGTHGQTGRRIAAFADKIRARTIVIGAPRDAEIAALFDADFSGELLRHAKCDVHVIADQPAGRISDPAA
ncbi:MAG TPA: MFS transporter [Acidimicrobiales bacterium]